jgi:hypothetical protein
MHQVKCPHLLYFKHLFISHLFPRVFLSFGSVPANVRCSNSSDVPDERQDMTVNLHQVGPAVVVVVDESATPCDITGIDGYSRSKRHIDERAIEMGRSSECTD